MVIVAAVALAPLVVVIAEAARVDVGVWRTLWQGRLGAMLVTTAVLLAAVSVGVLVLGAGLAWLVTAYEFPGVRVLRWALVLPLAMPAYVLGFVFLALFDFAGPLQTALRAVFGSGVWFPEVRTTAGAAVVLSLTLYPYVYLLARAALEEQAASTFEAARLLGDGRLRAALRVVLPLARPSLAAGVAVAGMETLTDFATLQYFNVQTVSVGVFRLWASTSQREAAIELSAVILVFAALVLAAERLLRGRRRYVQQGRGRPLERVRLHGWRAAAATTATTGVLAVALGLPLVRLVVWAATTPGTTDLSRMVEYASNSLGLAAAAAISAVAVGVLVAAGRRFAPGRVVSTATRLATIGYAVPGPVVAVGVLVVLTRGLAPLLGASAPTTAALALIGLVYAYTIRFVTLAYGAVDASLEKVTPSIVDAAHSLGAGPLRVLRDVYWPLVRPGVAAGALLVAIDAIKELAMVLMIRPFGFTTLSVWVWQLAAESRWSQAALPALTIVAAAHIPVVVHLRSQQRRRTPTVVEVPAPPLEVHR